MSQIDLGSPTRRSLGGLVDDRRIREVAIAVALLLWFYLALQLIWGPPLGIIVQGVVIGSLTALIAFGICLVYRANRIINFAAGDLGAVPAALAVLLIVGPGVPYIFALPTGLLAAGVLGALIQVLFIRRFRLAPRLILTVFTIGLSLLLAGFQLLLPRVFDLRVPPQDYPTPFDFRWRISPVTFTGKDIVAMLAVPAVVLFLGWFFRYTNMGIAVRASAESAERAALLGVNVGRVQLVVWILAAELAFLALFLRAGIVGLPIGTVLGPFILLRALAAAVIGRMERLGVVFVAAVGLGIVEQAVLFRTGRAVLVDAILLPVVLVALLLQRRGTLSRADDMQASTWQAIREVRPVPRELAHLPEVQFVFKGLTAAIAVFLLTLPLWAPERRVNLAGVVIIYGIIGISLVVLTGWAGQVSLGQMAFVGIGSAVAGYLTATRGWDVILSLVAAGVVGAVVAMLIGLPALRIRGLFLAVATLAFALCTSSYLLNDQFFGWLPARVRIPRAELFGRVSIATETRFYYLVLAGLVVALGAVRGLRRSRTGRTLIAIRENERGAQVFGVNAIRAKLTAFAISGFLAAYAGALFVHHQQSLVTGPFLPEQSLRVFLMVVVGGLGSVPGVLAGAVFLYGTQYFIRTPFLQFLTSGVGVTLVLLFLPGGLGSILYNLRDGYLRWVARRRDIVVSSLVADVRVEMPQPLPAPQPPEHGGQPAVAPSLAFAHHEGPAIAVALPEGPRLRRRRSP